MARKKKLPWSKAQLTVLHECWKASANRREFLAKISKKLPEIPSPIAWSLVRKLSRTDREWQMTARQKEREREERRAAKERLHQDRLKRRTERQQAQEWREQRTTLKEALDESYAAKISDKIGADFFFCSDMRQYVCRLACIFRVFSDSHVYGFSHGGPCDKCERMDEHIPVLQEIVRRSPNEKQKS